MNKTNKKVKDINDDKETWTIWWLLTKWNINSMADKPHSSFSFP